MTASAESPATTRTVRFTPMMYRDLPDVTRVDRECFQPPLGMRKISSLWRSQSRFQWRVLRQRESRARRVPVSAVVAYACYVDYGSWAHLLKLGCRRHERGQGLGRWLMLELLREMSSAGVTEVQLEVRAANAAARGLYAQLGFREVGMQARGYPDGEDAVLMTLSRLPSPPVQEMLAGLRRRARTEGRATLRLLEEAHA